MCPQKFLQHLGLVSVKAKDFLNLGTLGVLVELRHSGKFRHFSQGGDVEKLRARLGDKVADAFDRNSMRGGKG